MFVHALTHIGGRDACNGYQRGQLFQVLCPQHAMGHSTIRHHSEVDFLSAGVRETAVRIWKCEANPPANNVCASSTLGCDS